MLALAAYLRLGHPGVVEYKYDEARLSQLALDLAKGRHFPLLGMQSSVGFPNAPFNVYILAVPYFFTSSPVVATQFIGLLNVLAVGLTYVLLRRFTSPVPALIGTLLFATNPWSVHFSRKIWAQNMLPLFALLIVLTGFEGFLRDRRWARLAHLPLLAITGQIHYGAFVMIPVSVYLILQRRFSRSLLVSTVVALILFVPYLLGLAGAGLDNPSAARSVLSDTTAETDTNGLLSPEALEAAQLLVSGTAIHSLAGPEQFRNYLDTIPDVAYPLFRLVGWGVALSVIWLIIQRRYVAISIWFATPIVAFSLTWTEFFIHYLIPMLPAAFIVFGLALNDLTQYRRVFAITAGVFVFIALMQVLVWLSLLDFVDKTATPGGFGTPLHYLTRIESEVDAPDVLVNLDGHPDGIAQPVVWETLFYDRDRVRMVSVDTQIYPAGEATVVRSGCDGDQVVSLRDGEGCLSIEEPLAFPAAGYTLLSERFANGAELIGYVWDQGCLSLAWQSGMPVVEDYMFAVHLYDAEDRRIDVADGLSLAGRDWHAGDVVVRRFCGDMAGVETAKIGMYTYDGTHFYGVDLVDDSGQMVTLLLR